MNKPDPTVVEAIRTKGHLLLVTHINPDGDALGSMLGLADILDGIGKKVVCYADAPVSPLYRFLPGCAQVQTDMSLIRSFVAQAGDDLLTLCLDCGEEKRLGEQSSVLMTFQPVMVIDHHKSNSGFGVAAWVEPHRSSTGEMIYDLACSLGAEISQRAAECLYAAILTDTGSFCYESTSSHTFAVAGELVGRGVRPEIISSNLYDNYTLGRLRLMEEVLATLEMHERDRIAVIHVSQQMLERTFTTMADTEYFINLPRAVRSVRVAVFVKEIAEDVISVSLRAKGQCDVSLIAGKFGGGGHRNASGFRLQGRTMGAILTDLLPLLREAVTQS